MSIMKILNSVEQEQFESPPVFNSVQRKQYLISLSGRSARSARAGSLWISRYDITALGKERTRVALFAYQLRGVVFSALNPLMVEFPFLAVRMHL
jgi:hypothetical protein